MRAKKLLTSRQIFRYAVPARTVTKKALPPPIKNPGYAMLANSIHIHSATANDMLAVE